MRRLLPASRAAVLVQTLCVCSVASAGPSPCGQPPAGGEGEDRVAVTHVEKQGAKFQLIRDGQPYLIKGAGGSGPLDALARAGGNSVRTWGADRAGEVLDEARRHGLTVTLGIWLGHERHGFSYNNADQVARQYEEAKATILRYKDHPALLMWGIGNEMEGFEKGDNAAVWSAVNNLAAMVKALDPNHPTMTVVAEINGDRVKNIHRLCPDVDVVGINSYGNAATIPGRYRAAGGKKPYVLTEFGPAGRWETKPASWGAPLEPTSTEKARTYRGVYEKAVLGSGGLCLGSYAFTWGYKQEATATWFGLLLPDGSRTGAVDALTELWTGKPPANRCPQIDHLKLDAPPVIEPGATVRAMLDASDPEGDLLSVQWVLQREPGSYGSGGDAEAAPPTFPEAFVKAGPRQAEVKLPKGSGGYRLYAYVRDGHGGAATANVPFLIKGPQSQERKSAVRAPAAKLPLVIYAEGESRGRFPPSGWMGDTGSIALDADCREDPHSGKTCLRVDFKAAMGWGGVVWQDPPNDWGDAPGGLDLTGARRLTLWARGAKGGEIVSFAFGLLGPDKKYHDSAAGKLEKVVLTSEWKQYIVPLGRDKDLSRIKTPFSWTVAVDGKPVTFYLDDIRYEKD